MKEILQTNKDYVITKTLIFDLDETLIHCMEDQMGKADARIPIKFPNGKQIMAKINIRTYAQQIIKNLSKYFEIVIFTASH